MQVQHVPTGVWDWRGSALVFIVVAAPQVALLGVASELRRVSMAAAVGGLVTYLAILLVALVVYLQYRLTGSSATAWLAACLSLASVQGMAWAFLRLAAPERAALLWPWPAIVDLACGLCVLAMLLLATRLPLHRDPMAVGVILGILLASVRLGLFQSEPTLNLNGDAYALLNIAVFAVFCGIAWRVALLPGVPPWVGWRFALSIVLLSLSLSLSNHAPATWLGVATLLLNPVGAVLLSSAALAWLRQSIGSNQEAIARLADRLHTVEADQQADRERLHEINGTIAGIASASRLIQENPTLPEHHVDELRKMVDTEVERLERLMQDRQLEPLRPVNLDEIIQVLATAQRALGRTVYWQPSGQVVQGRPDDVTEVLNILLNNATRHAPGSPTAIAVERDGQTVRVAVSDWGPGVPLGLRSRIFEPDECGPDSPGEGIGLAVARRLMTEQGGYVRLEETPGTGATFVMGLHSWEGADDTAIAR